MAAWPSLCSLPPPPAARKQIGVMGAYQRHDQDRHRQQQETSYLSLSQLHFA
jgi:hypothetical protein